MRHRIRALRIRMARLRPRRPRVLRNRSPAHRLFLRRRTTARVPREGSHEQRTSEHAAWRLRSAYAMAGVPRTAKGCVARPARCVESPAVRVQSEVSACVWAASSFCCRTIDPGGDWHCVAVDLLRPYCFGEFLDLVRQMVAAAADRRGTGDAGRVGAGFTTRSASAARDRIRGRPDSACCHWIFRFRNFPRNMGSVERGLGRPR